MHTALRLLIDTSSIIIITITIYSCLQKKNLISKLSIFTKCFNRNYSNVFLWVFHIFFSGADKICYVRIWDIYFYKVAFLSIWMSDCAIINLFIYLHLVTCVCFITLYSNHNLKLLLNIWKSIYFRCFLSFKMN